MFTQQELAAIPGICDAAVKQMGISAPPIVWQIAVKAQQLAQQMGKQPGPPIAPPGLNGWDSQTQNLVG